MKVSILERHSVFAGFQHAYRLQSRSGTFSINTVHIFSFFLLFCFVWLKTNNRAVLHLELNNSSLQLKFKRCHVFFFTLRKGLFFKWIVLSGFPASIRQFFAPKFLRQRDTFLDYMIIACDRLFAQLLSLFWLSPGRLLIGSSRGN